MRVLVVEDEADLQRLIGDSLREQGYAVDTAGDGNTGLVKATSWQYDAIVLDLMLPGMDGWELLSQLRRTKSTPVLILTARDSVSDRVRGLDRGADDYLVKPFELSELLARLRALIRRSVGRSDPLVNLGEVTIDTASRTVTRSSSVVNLTSREYALVELLALKRGELVTRTQIYDHLFDEDDDTMSNVVDVHVSNIRKKLGKNIITTRRGQGYLIEDTPEEE